MSFDKPKMAKGFKQRGHHTRGARQIKSGRTFNDVVDMARRLRIPYLTKSEADRKRDKDGGK